MLRPWGIVHLLAVASVRPRLLDVLLGLGFGHIGDGDGGGTLPNYSMDEPPGQKGRPPR